MVPILHRNILNLKSRPNSCLPHSLFHRTSNIYQSFLTILRHKNNVIPKIPHSTQNNHSKDDITSYLLI